MNREGSRKWNITASHTLQLFLEQKQNQELLDVLFIAPRKPLLYSGENKTLLGHTQPLAIGTIFTLVSAQEFAFPNLLLYPRNNSSRAQGLFLLMSQGLSLLWGCSTLHCMYSFWEENPITSKEQQIPGVYLEIKIWPFASVLFISLSCGHPFLLCKQTLVIAVAYHTVNVVGVTCVISCRNLLSYNVTDVKYTCSLQHVSCNPEKEL